MRLIALLLCLLCAAPAYAQNETVQAGGTITIEDSTGQDAAIAKRIRDILNELDGYDEVRVTVSSGIVTLRGETVDTALANDLTGLVSRVEGVVAIENEVAATTDVRERLNPAVDRFLARAGQIVAFLPLALVAFAVFAAIVFVGFFLARLRQPWNRLAPNAFIADIYRQILRLFFILAGLVVALDILNATALLSGILGAAGIVGLAIGFAVRDTVENFIASIMLSIRQPFRPNDTVEIEGDIGKVIRLTSRATILLSFDGNHIRIPNATVFKSRVVNYTRNAERRFTFALTIAPDADLAEAQHLAEDVLLDLPFVLREPAVSVWVESVDDCWVTLQMAAWIDQRETSIVLARSEAIRLTQAAFDTAGIAAPLPSYRLVHEGGPAGVPGPAEPPRPRTPPAPAEPVQDTAADSEKELEKIVDLERAADEDDLLSENAAQE